jgi:peptide deformylase
LSTQYRRTYSLCWPVVNPAEARADIDKLLEALDADLQAVALAAPQIGIQCRMFAMRPGRVFINPTILKTDGGLVTELEGCRSLPNIKPVPVSRHRRVSLMWINENGETQIGSFSGYDARVIQHEIDHLDGIMINARNANT